MYQNKLSHLPVIILGGIFSAMTSVTAMAADISVCPAGCDHTSIQQGITAALSGDRVVVGTPGRTTPETYDGNIVMKEGIELISQGDNSTAIYTDPFAQVAHDFSVLKRTTLTIIRGAGSSAVILFPNIGDATVDGFIIENIDDTAPDFTGLMMLGNASPNIRNNIVRDNQGTGTNPGIMMRGDIGMTGQVTQPVIENNLIHYVNGPGISIASDAYPVIRGNTIFTTPPDSIGHKYMAPGIGLRDSASAIIENNELFSNRPAGIGSGSGFSGDGKGYGIYDSGNLLTIRSNVIYDNMNAGIAIAGQSGQPTSGVEVLIEYNDISNSMAGVRIVHENGTQARIGSVTIRGNSFENHTAGIYAHSINTLLAEDNDITGNSTGIRTNHVLDMSIRNNQISDNSWAGIAMFSQTLYPITFLMEGNTILNSGRAGIRLNANPDSVGTVRGNLIDGSGIGGIAIWSAMTVSILDNEIRNSIRGGIHSGNNQYNTTSTPPLDGGNGNLHVTVRGNKIHHNGQDFMGGGIDLRHASGTIENNLVYKNHMGGIRFGDWMDAINHNTVVQNGMSTTGGGIVYDDLAGPVNEMPPSGWPATGFPMRNNIIVDNAKAGVNAGTLASGGATCSDWVGQRDYNLLSENNGTSTSCHGATWPFCILPQLALCSKNPGELIAAPQFVDRANDDYHLQTGSAAIGSGDGGVDMGAFGGPNAINW